MTDLRQDYGRRRALLRLYLTRAGHFKGQGRSWWFTAYDNYERKTDSELEPERVPVDKPLEFGEELR